MTGLPQTAVHITVQGRVQGVGFRYFTQEEASASALGGWVRNVSDGSVEVYAVGEKSVLEAFLTRLRAGPPLSRVDAVSTRWETAQEKFESFTIR